MNGYTKSILASVVPVILWLSRKTLPFAYVLRFYYGVYLILHSKRGQYKITKKNTFGLNSKNDKLAAFQSSRYRTHVSPFEIDMYLHKSNSTYFTDLDMARAHLLMEVLQTFWFKYYFNERGEFKSTGYQNIPFVPVAAVQLAFKKEFKVLENYDIVSNIFAWDRKWLYVISKFVRPHEHDQLCAFGLTKYVFKKHRRITISPEEVIKDAGLWSDQTAKENDRRIKVVERTFSIDDLEEFIKHV